MLQAMMMATIITTTILANAAVACAARGTHNSQCLAGSHQIVMKKLVTVRIAAANENKTQIFSRQTNFMMKNSIPKVVMSVVLRQLRPRYCSRL